MTIKISDTKHFSETTETSESVVVAINSMASEERPAITIWEAPTDIEMDLAIDTARGIDCVDCVYWGGTEMP